MEKQHPTDGRQTHFGRGLAPHREKLSVVRLYLKSEFPGCTIYHRHDNDLGAYTFHISKHVMLHVTKFAEDYLDTTDIFHLNNDLKKWNLAHYIRRAGRSTVIVSRSGPGMLR